jgi:hypothetical protein
VYSGHKFSDEWPNGPQSGVSSVVCSGSNFPYGFVCPTSGFKLAAAMSTRPGRNGGCHLTHSLASCPRYRVWIPRRFFLPNWREKCSKRPLTCIQKQYSTFSWSLGVCTHFAALFRPTSRDFSVAARDVLTTCKTLRVFMLNPLWETSRL